MQLVEPTGSGFTRGLNRVAAFLTWQSVAFVAAMVLAWITRRAVARGSEEIKLLGYLPLAISVFIVVSIIAIIVLQNLESTSIDVLFWSITSMPKLVLIFLSMIIGASAWELARRLLG